MVPYGAKRVFRYFHVKTDLPQRWTGAGEVYDGPADLPTTYNNYPEQLSASILLSIFSREFKPSGTK